MLRIFLMILEKYGMDVLQITIIGYCFFKLFTNHLAHMNKNIDKTNNGVEKIDKKVDVLGERVSKIEGKISIMELKRKR